MDPTRVPPLAGEHHVCGECPMSYADTSVESATAALRGVPDEVRAAVSAVAPALRRTRPDATTWSVVEYACHVRDVFSTSTIRLYRTRTEDAPVHEPMLNDLRTVRFRHNEADLDAVLADLDAHLAGFLDEIAATTDWERVGRRRPDEVRTARWLVRHALHEARHHVHDIGAVGRAVSAPR
ncbi:DinB family protein [Pseudonocardia sichuanensis]